MTPAQLALGIALKCLPPALAPVAAGIALHENPALNARAVHHNPNGTDDFGLGQVNEVNFGWLSQSMHTPVNASTLTGTDPLLLTGIDPASAHRFVVSRRPGDIRPALKQLFLCSIAGTIPPSRPGFGKTWRQPGGQ